MRFFPFIFIVIFLTGCQTMSDLPGFKRMVPVTVVSFPPGAVIEVDGNYEGRTPNVIELIEFHLDRDADVPAYKVFIYPAEESYCTKKMALNPYDIPPEISFDLTQCQGEPETP